jgi:anti-sigma factor RsiW
MNDRELLILYRDGELPEAQRARVEERLRTDSELRASLERLESVAAALGLGAATSFEPFFAARVVARLRQSRQVSPVEAMYDSLRWMFARLAVACVVLILSLGAYSALGGGYTRSLVDAMLGLPEATLQTALTLGG